MSETRVPSIPPIDRNAPNSDVLKAIKELLEVRESRRGDPLDANLTFRDLYEVGVVGIRVNGAISYNNAPDDTVAAPKQPLPDKGEDDFSVPSTPTGLKATGGIKTILVEWDSPSAYNHAYTEVWRADTNNVGLATKVGNAAGNLYPDQVPSGVTRWYWIRFVSTANVIGPYNAVSGTSATTGQVGTADISANSITAGSGIIGDLAVDNIHIADGAINARTIQAGVITADKIAANTITADKLSVSALSAITANLGTITAGNMTLDASGFIRGGQSAYDTGSGFYLGYGANGYMMSIGNSGLNASMNPADKGTKLSLSGGALKHVGAAQEWSGIRSTSPFTSGKWYWEVMPATNTKNTFEQDPLMIGIGNASASVEAAYFSANVHGFSLYNLLSGTPNQQSTYYDGLPTLLGSGTFVPGDTIGIALDADARTITFYRNGSSQGLLSIPAGLTGALYAMVALYNPRSACVINFGPNFSYAPPTGYKAARAGSMTFDGSRLEVKGDQIVRGTLFGANGVFSGELNAVNGTFNVVTAGLLMNRSGNYYLNLNSEDSSSYFLIGPNHPTYGQMTIRGDGYTTLPQASVGTLTIQGDAVTVPVSASGVAQAFLIGEPLNDPHTYQVNLYTHAYSSQGRGQGCLLFYGEAAISLYVSGGSQGIAGGTEPYINLERNGTVLEQSIIPAGALLPGNATTTLQFRYAMVLDTPGAGANCLYRLTLHAGAMGGAVFATITLSKWSLIVLETKR